MVEYTVAKGADETNQIDGNIYVGRIQNVLPGMELAFVDIGIPKNAVLYAATSRSTPKTSRARPSNDKRIEEMIKSGQTIICQVTKNAIGAKGARSPKRSPPRALRGARAELVDHRHLQAPARRRATRLRKIIDDVKPERHGIIIRTAAEGVTADDLARDVSSLAEKWSAIEAEGPSPISRASSTATSTSRCACCAKSSTTTTAGSSLTTGALREGARVRAGGQPRVGRPHRVLRPRDRRAAALRALLRPRAAAPGP
jgi:Rne/Rng family ribonuclease